MNPGSLALALFATISIIYFMLKYYIGGKGNFMIWNLIYYLLVIVTMFSININTTKSNCGFPSYGIAALATIIPWLIIFGLLNIMLLMFPGWLSPFSNTFGYLLAKLNGVSDTFDNIFKSKMVKKDAPAALQNASEALEHIYSNKSLLLNEITTQNFSDFWSRMTPLFKADANNYKEELFNFVRMKTIVSEFVWYMLTGGLITTMSYNYILNSGCNPDSNQMSKNYTQYKDNLASKNSEKKKRKIYNL